MGFTNVWFIAAICGSGALDAHGEVCYYAMSGHACFGFFVITFILHPAAHNVCCHLWHVMLLVLCPISLLERISSRILILVFCLEPKA